MPSESGEAWKRLLSATSTATLRTLGSGNLAGKRLLITGAGGSIGSALAQAIAAAMPESLILLDSSENGLYEVDRALRHAGCQRHAAILGSVCDGSGLKFVLAQHKPQIIFHAAALKQVPLMEQNPFAAIETNVLGTHALITAAAATPVEQMVLISTDKAVDPCSIMGASKRIAELLFLNAQLSSRLTIVRLCNVMGSQGSVLPLFLEQIAKGGPVTVTDPKVERYFITLTDALKGLLQALDVRSDRTLLVPTVGPALRIVDLARYLIRSTGSNACIEFTGLRPGDKLVEQLMSKREHVLAATDVSESSMRIVQSDSEIEKESNGMISLFREAVRTRDLPLLLRGVSELVPEYKPSKFLGTEPVQRVAEEMAEVRV